MIYFLLRHLRNTIKKSIHFVRGNIQNTISDAILNQETILIVCESNVPRIERMLFYLRKIRKEQFVVICSKAKFQESFFKRCQDVTVVLVDGEWQIPGILKQFKKIKLIHAFESRSIYAYYALKSKGKNIPFIFDFQDLYTNYTGDKKLPKWMRENLYFEAYCLRNSDAFVSYSLELIPARKTLGIGKKPTIYFPFYLDDAEIKKPSLKTNDERIDIVYAGGIAALNRNVSFNLSLTEKNLRNSNVFLHIYPSPSSGKDVIEEYKLYARQFPNLIMHNPVPNNAMGAELNQYHYGIVPFFKTVEYKSTNKYKYSSALKIWNYLEAGLPIIIAADVEYQAWLIKHYGVGVVVNENEFKDISKTLNAQNLDFIHQNIVELQKQKTLSSNISKIDSLYSQRMKVKN